MLNQQSHEVDLVPLCFVSYIKEQHQLKYVQKLNWIKICPKYILEKLYTYFLLGNNGINLELKDWGPPEKWEGENLYKIIPIFDSL